ncbi:MAG TPA: anthranilate synthase component I [Candidatus Magasanikbacteria bacterium]|nr:anthranilate synthase component I [Candidatus Magasanikbacteria bacterium]
MILPKINIPQKPIYINVATDIDFLELFRKIEKEYDNCFMFESLGEKSRSSRYSVIGFAPEHIIRAKNNDLYFDEQKFTVKNPYESLREIVPQDIISRRYAGGLVGYLSYEAVNYFEPNLNVKIHDKFDQFMFGVYTDGLVFDNVTNQLFYFYYFTNRLPEIEILMNKEIKDKELFVQFRSDSLSETEHCAQVEIVKEYIRGGYTFQCEVGFKSEYEISGDAFKIYDKLRKVNPSPYMYYVKFGDPVKKDGAGIKLIGASPELLFSLTQGEVETHPLAGTIKRGKTDLEDRQLARKLLNDPKEMAEHNMLVDMHRNDIGKVSQFGTVKIRSLMDIKKFSHVQHIGSEISGIIDSQQDMFSGLASLLPGGVLCGAPKIETIKIIDSMEKQARGPYGGGVGLFGFNGDATFAIPIRTLFIADKYAYTQTCSGIVYDSIPYREYDEIQRKLAAMKQTLGQFCYYM